MRKPLCVFSADWHLEKNAWVRHPDLAGDSYYGLEQVVDLCLMLHLPLIAAGDLFNKSYPDAKSVYIAMLQMDRMQNKELAVYFVQGQHEFSKDQPWLGLHSWPVHLHNQSVKIGSKTFVGLDYTRPDDLIEALNICKDADILVSHQVWKELMAYGEETKLSSVPFVEVVLTGDFHKHTSLKLKGASKQDLLVLSAGSLCMQTLDEPSAKAIHVLYDDYSYESVPIKSRVVSYFEIETEEDLQNMLSTLEYGTLEPQEGVPESIKKPIVSVKYNPDLNSVYSDIQNAIGSRAHLFLKPISSSCKEESYSPEEVNKAQEVIEAGLEGNLVKHCAVDSFTYSVARRLLKSDNPKEELNLIETEFFERKENGYCYSSEGSFEDR